MVKINLGCGWRDFGKDWVHIDDGNYKHLDYKTNVNELTMFQDSSVDLIYVSHVIAYFNRMEIIEVFKEWKRILKKGGVLRIATPDAGVLMSMYVNNEIELKQVLGPLYGKMEMGENNIYHKTTYDYNSLVDTLISVGFIDVERYDWRDTEHSEFDDHSQAYIPHMDKDNGKLISLNITCKK